MSALDELRFGPERTLNLREHLPVAEEAQRRAEQWLRQHQVQGSPEVLIITGRGNQSVDGIPVVRNAIEKLLYSLRRRGVVAAFHAHNPGAFVVQPAAVRALVDAPRRRRENGPRSPLVDIHGLSPDTMGLLRDLAEAALDALGVASTETRVIEEMRRQLSAIVPALSGEEDADVALQSALRGALAEYED